MHLELSELLQRSFSSDNDPSQALLKQIFDYAEKTLGVAAEGSPAQLDAIAARLLWIASHYISASSASHGLQLGYVEQDVGQEHSLVAHIGQLLEALPTSVVLNTLCLAGVQVRAQSYAGGGKRTPFEAEDLAHFCGKAGIAERMGSLVIRYDRLDAGYQVQVNSLITAQSVIAHVLVVRPMELAALDCPILASSHWEVIHLSVGAVALDVYRNTQWDWQLGLLPALDMAPSVIPLAGAQPKKWLPMVSVAKFGGVNPVDFIPAETLAGPEINFYSIEKSGSFARKIGRFSPINAQERLLHECLDVNISYTGVIWRDNHVLFDSFYAHFTDLKRLSLERNEAIVSEPTTHLEGTYFLSVTSTTHHSHLIFETLRKLHFADRFQPAIKLLTSSTLSQSQRDYFELFGFPPERCVYKHPDETCRVERLIYSSEAPMSYDRVSVDYLRSFGVAHCPGRDKWPSRIYISRRDSRVYRSLVNEEEIEKIFEWFGFSVISASALSPQEKVELFAAARYVAGPLGAAFSYMPFSLDGTTIMLTSEAYFPVEFQEIAAIRLKKLNVIFGVSLQMFSPVWQYGHNSFYLPPGLVISALGEILNVDIE